MFDTLEQHDKRKKELTRDVKRLEQELKILNRKAKSLEIEIKKLKQMIDR